MYVEKYQYVSNRLVSNHWSQKMPVGLQALVVFVDPSTKARGPALEGPYIYKQGSSFWLQPLQAERPSSH
ncbi:hypothetical protein N7540_009965 [Penicillium herquei]|nr:hypothetical protein N7540_009965 [Penicillium herquei]